MVSSRDKQGNEVAHVWVVGSKLESQSISPSTSNNQLRNVGDEDEDEEDDEEEDPEDWVDFFGLTVLKSGPPFTHIATLSTYNTDSSSGTSGDDSIKSNVSTGHVCFDWVCCGLSQKVTSSVNELRGSWLSSIHQKNIALWYTYCQYTHFLSFLTLSLSLSLSFFSLSLFVTPPLLSFIPSSLLAISLSLFFLIYNYMSEGIFHADVCDRPILWNLA